MAFDDRPGSLDRAISAWLEAQQTGALRGKAHALTEAYKHGRNSSSIDLTAYLTARMPATFAAIGKVLSQVAEVAPLFSPKTILDVGAGPGTASWAALAQWPDIATATMIEADTRFVSLATELARASEIPALENAKMITAKLAEGTVKADLVLAAYVFAELEERAAGEVATHLWKQAEHLLVIVEPGTPRGFVRIRKARAALLAEGGHVVGPCTHAGLCPMQGNDWCHFTQRLARSREHMHAKSASVPFEDESFSWLAVSRQAYTLPYARVIAPPIITKAGATIKICDDRGLSTTTIASRDKQAYKRAKKLGWGDLLPITEE